MIRGPIVSDRLYQWRRQLFRFGIWNIVYRFWITLYVDGWENIPADGPVVMMGNHISALDPGIMISFYPDRDIVPLAKIEAFSQPVMRFFVGHWGAIPVHRGEPDLKALKSALEHLRQGYIVMLYAEGTRSKTGLIRGQEGSAYLALKTNATVVPVAIWGTRDFPATWIREFRRTPVYVRFGRPFRFRHEGKRLPREHFRAMTDEAMYRIAELLPEEWRGVYSDLSQATTDFLDFDITWRPVERRIPRWVISTGWVSP
ncbi:MAG TPA: 1-acyl-sn-glycerol-3-phosphate acyltransferase [Chloroflexi bacterium]|nr:1-acyl-sn-glycerol-3-phosphate acyltransferase [Chloroflexota bacterium]